jgi:uncharacterized membrane protein YccC
MAGALVGGLWAVCYLVALYGIHGSNWPAFVFWALSAAVMGSLVGLLICGIWQIVRCISRNSN